jgi:malonyl-CoA O-methyltransferase
MNRPNQPFALRQVDVQRHFDRAAGNFADADFVHRHCFDGVIERLQPMRLKATRILDLGCAAGTGSRELARRFRRARVTSLDLSRRMLQAGKSARSRFARIREVQADAAALPFATGSFDLVVANLLLPWIDRPGDVFAEIRRVLQKDGLFAFSTLGPDSLLELRQAWQLEDEFAHVNLFADMHNVGDALVQAGLGDPVLDVDGLAVSYEDIESLHRDLRAAGAGNALRDRRRTLTGKARLQRASSRLFGEAGQAAIVINLELVFGHAWGSGPALPAGEFHVDPAAIGRI